MYLARQRIKHTFHFFIRQSITGPGYLQSRDLFDLGTDPTQYIIYPGGNSYYIDPCIEESLREQGLEVSQDDLDMIFFEFLKPATQRIISGFDRGLKRRRKRLATQSSPEPHRFDKRRYHYLRFGSRGHLNMDCVPDKFFLPLLYKSRDEIEQYFLTAERILRPNERLNYISVIFELTRFTPDPHSDLPLISQLDGFFIDRLCRLNADVNYKAGLAINHGLIEYLVEYAIMYFDAEAAHHQYSNDYIRDFINRHRAYRPPQKIRTKMEEAERLFGCSWKELRSMDRPTLVRIYRQLALKHHPDHGGRSEIFQRLTAYYRALLAKK